jgi:hypothetical protein
MPAPEHVAIVEIMPSLKRKMAIIAAMEFRRRALMWKEVREPASGHTQSPRLASAAQRLDGNAV